MKTSRQRLLLFIALGYGYLAALVAVLCGVIVLMFTTRLVPPQLVWLPGGLLLLVLSSLRVRIDNPEGRRLTPLDAPGLHDLIEEVRRALDAPAPHEVLLSSDVNASIVDVPRFLVLGSRRSLTIGLPLLQVLPESELRAVLAHEFAHFSRRHGRSRARAVRLATTWAALAFATQSSRNWSAVLFVPFFRWYAPRFEALTETDSREQEYESDRLASSVSEQDALGRALLRIALAEAYAQSSFWPALRRESLERATPTEDAVLRLFDAIGGYLSHARAATWLRSLVRDHALEHDTHPSLSDRLKALGVPVAPDDAIELIRILQHVQSGSAADRLFTQQEMRRYARELSELWEAVTLGQWRQWHADARLWVESEGQAPAGVLFERHVLRAKARWVSVCEPPETAIAQLGDLIQRVPDDIEVRVRLGRLLIEHGRLDDQPAAVELLESTMAEESVLALDAAESLRRYYTREGLPREARRCLLRERQLQRAALAGLRERSTLTHRDTLRPCPIPSPTRATFIDALRERSLIRRAYLVQKRTRHLSATGAAALAIEVDLPWYRFSLGTVATEACEALAEVLSVPDGGDLVIIPIDRHSRLRRRLDGIAGAEIYSRDAPALQPVSTALEWHSPPSRALAFTLAGIAATCIVVLAIFLRTSEGDPSWSDRLPTLEQAALENPDDGQVQLQLAWGLIEAQRIDDALPVARKAVELDPTSADARNTFGWILLRRAAHDEAIASFEHAIRLDPDHDQAHHNLGFALATIEEFDAAVAAYQEAIRVAPDRHNAHSEYARVLYELARFPEAERAMRQALRLDPENAEYAGGLGSILKQQGRTQEALRLYRNAVMQHPDDVRFWLEIGTIEHMHGRYAESIDAFRRAERLQPDVFAEYEIGRMMLEASLAGRPYQP